MELNFSNELDKEALAEYLIQDLQKKQIFPAHIRLEEELAIVQTVEEHCENTAHYASKCLESVGLENCAYVAGAFHDVGKFSECYLEYLVYSVVGLDTRRGSVNHTFCGVRELLSRRPEPARNEEEYYIAVATEHIATAIGSHHGLFDLIDVDGKSGFCERQKRECPEIKQAEAYLKRCDIEGEAEERLRVCSQEIQNIYKKLRKVEDQRENFEFCVAQLTRLLTSALIEGDRRDTAEFMNGQKFSENPQDMTKIWSHSLAHLERILASFPHDTPIQQGRAAFAEKCRDFAERPSGIYRLNLPTGAGKTLSSLRFALAHAKCCHKHRIFFVIPLLAIVDQNADVIRNAVGDSSIVLEHHSNVVRDGTQTDNEFDRRELLMETWNAPIIITTLVQMLNTMFSDKTSCVRRFHTLIDSVIIFDEVQTVPTRMLSLFNLTIRFLAEVCGATIILCSATQPALEAVQRPLSPVPEEMVPYDEQKWKIFRRTEIIRKGTMTLEEIADFAEKEFRHSMLIVCNKKDEALQLYTMLKNSLDVPCFHLSTAMCMTHRKETLKAFVAAKKANGALCISTQIVEAGVDISVDTVIRLQAGMDSVIQAAGRCNRNGESEELGRVFVIDCAGEKLTMLPEIQRGKQSTADLFAEYQGDYSSEEAIRTYYRAFYRDGKLGEQDFIVDVDGMEVSIFDLLSQNKKFLRGAQMYYLNQAYKTAGQKFQVFKDNTTDIVVPYNKSKELICQLEEEKLDFEQQRALIQKLKPYTISIYDYQKKKLDAEGAICCVADAVLVLADSWYKDDIGLKIENNLEEIFLGV